MTHSDLHRLSPDEPVWGLVAQLSAHRYTGEVVVSTQPIVRIWVLDGRVYLAERDGDPSIAQRIEAEGLVTPSQLQQGSVVVGDHVSLARLFARRPDIDRDAVELDVALATEAVLTEVGSQPVGPLQWAPLRHHPSGVHLWQLVPAPGAVPPTIPTVAPAPTVASPSTVAPAPSLAAVPAPTAAASTRIEPVLGLSDLPDLGDFDLEAVRAAILATPTPTLEPLPPITPAAAPPVAPVHHLADTEARAIWEMVDALPDPVDTATVGGSDGRATIRRRWWSRRNDTADASTPRPAKRVKEPKAPKPPKQAKDPEPPKGQQSATTPAPKPKPKPKKAKADRPNVVIQPRDPAKPPKPPKAPKAPKPAKAPKRAKQHAASGHRPTPSAAPAGAADVDTSTPAPPQPAKAPAPPKPRKVKAKKQPVIIPNKPKPSKGRPAAGPAPDAQPNGGTP